jgi:hypothetical protein
MPVIDPKRTFWEEIRDGENLIEVFKHKKIISLRIPALVRTWLLFYHARPSFENLQFKGKNKMKKLLLALIVGFAFIGVQPVQAADDLTDTQFYGYKVTHHMGAMIQHIEKFGFNTFDHPPIADYRFFVITPALDHFYSKAVIDTRWGPVIVDTPARDDRYASLLVTDMEHFGIYAELTEQKGQRFVVVREDYKGALPEGTLIKTKSDFPLIFLRTQTFAFNQDKLSDGIRRQAKIHGAWQHVDLPNEKDPQAIIKWTIDHTLPYPQTEKLMVEASKTHTAEVHKETFEYVFKYLQTGEVTGSAGMFDAVDSKTGASHLVRAAGTLLGHLGFPTHHAYYQNTPVDRKGRVLDGANGPFVLTAPYNPEVDWFWSITRYENDTRLPINPAEIGGNNIQAYNAFNTKPDKDGNVTITFSRKDPKDGTYWMPVTDDYYFISRYYGPNSKMNGKTVHDVLFAGTPLAEKFKAEKF